MSATTFEFDSPIEAAFAVWEGQSAEKEIIDFHSDFEEIQFLAEFLYVLRLATFPDSFNFKGEDLHDQIKSARSQGCDDQWIYRNLVHIDYP